MASVKRTRLRLQRGPDGLEQAEAQRAVVAGERDHEAYAPMARRLGIACQGADAGKSAGLEAGALAAAEQGGMRLQELQHPGKAARREAVAAADARAFLEPDGLRKVVLREQLVRDLKRLLEADRPAEAMPA